MRQVRPSRRADDEAIPDLRAAPVGFALGSVAAVMSAAGTLWIGVLMLLIVADVIGRNLLDAPITGVAEMAGHSVVAIVFLQTASAIMQGRLTRADFLFRRIAARSPAAAGLIDALFSLTGAAVFALIAWASWDKMLGAFAGNEFFGVQGVFIVPTWPFRAIIVVGAILAALAALYRVVNRTAPAEGAEA